MQGENRLSDAELDQEFDKNRRSFRNAVSDCQLVSRTIAGRQVDDRRWWASVLLARFCTTAMSLLKLLPESPLERDHSSELGSPLDRHWDFTAVAALGRTLFENHLTLFYLCFEEIDDDEWLSRLNLMQMHDHNSRKRTFGGPTSDEDRAQEKNVTADLEQKLLSRRFFQSLPASQRKMYLRGERACFHSHEEILTRMGQANTQSYMAVWRWWSAHIHSLPMSYYRMAELNRGVGLENRSDKQNISLALGIITESVDAVCAAIRKLFPDVPSRDDFVHTAIRQVLRSRKPSASDEEKGGL